AVSKKGAFTRGRLNPAPFSCSGLIHPHASASSSRSVAGCAWTGTRHRRIAEPAEAQQPVGRLPQPDACSDANVRGLDARVDVHVRPRVDEIDDILRA